MMPKSLKLLQREASDIKCLVTHQVGKTPWEGFSRFLGVNKESVAKFSFLLSLPAILGASILKLNELFALNLTAEQWLYYSLAIVSSAISGYYAIYIVMDFVKRGRFMYFGFYCIAVSLIGLIGMQLA